MKYGYARVSTKDQNVEIQIDELIAAGIDKANIFTDVGVSGKHAIRPGLDALLELVQPGDDVVVTKLDRLSRSMIHTAQLAESFREGASASGRSRSTSTPRQHPGDCCSTCSRRLQSTNGS